MLTISTSAGTSPHSSAISSLPRKTADLKKRSSEKYPLAFDFFYNQLQQKILFCSVHNNIGNTRTRGQLRLKVLKVDHFTTVGVRFLPGYVPGFFARHNFLVLTKPSRTRTTVRRADI
jgi:hypothetical protein